MLTAKQLNSLSLQTRLISATMEDNVTEMQSAISQGALLDEPGDLLPTSIHQMTPICVASQYGSLKAIQFLIEQGAKLEATEESSTASPLMLAARNGNLAVFDLLWMNGASRDADMNTCDTLLHAATSAGSTAILERIKTDDPQLFAKCLEAKNVTHYTPLVCAMAKQLDDVAFWLVRAGANVNASDSVPEASVLRWALLCPLTAFLDMLLAHPQFDPSPITAGGESGVTLILAEAAVAGLVRSVDFLLKHVAGAKGDCIAVRFGGQSVLAATCRHCTADSVVDVVALLIEHGAKIEDDRCNNVQVSRGVGSSALTAALCSQSAPATKQSLVTLLLRAGANVAREELLLVAAECSCSVELVQQVIDAGAPASMAAVFACAEAGSAALFDVICNALEFPLDVNAVSSRGRTLLHHARLGCAVLARLIDAGANVDARDLHEYTPLMLVPKECDAEFFLLLERGANAQAAVKFGGYTVLHHAVSAGCPERVRRLLAAGADANSRDGTLKTPLFYCVDPESARLLVAAGASPCELVGNMTPISFALRKPDVLRALLSVGGNVEEHGGDSLVSLCLRPDSGPGHTMLSYRYNIETTLIDNDVIAACVQILIDAGASCVRPNAHDGTVPLHFAVRDARGRRPLGVLLRNGAIADLERADNRGRTPRDFAEQSRSRLIDVIEHDGVMMLVAMGVEPLPLWIEPLKTAKARAKIESYRFEVVRQRAADVLIALQSLSLSALEMVHIIEALSPVGGVSFDKMWQLATTVKHFNQKAQMSKVKSQNL